MSKYVFIIPTLGMGGAERVISVLSSALYQAGEEVCVIKYFDIENEYFVDQGVRVINISGGDRCEYNKLSYFHKILRIRKALKLEKPDFVLPFLYSVSQCVAFASIGLNLTVAQSIRINPEVAPYSKILRFFRDLLVYKSKFTFVQNVVQKRYFKRCDQSKIHVLYNPVSENLFSVLPEFKEEPYIICSMGRLEKQKNFTLLIDSFYDVLRYIPNAQLCIYGEGTLKETLLNHIKEIGMSEHIFLMGKTNDIEATYKNVNMFVLSSDYEGMPNALIEAMACGIPCISTDCPTGPSNLIENNKNGILVPVNDKDSMVEAIKNIFFSEDKGIGLGSEARKTIKEKCSSTKIVAQLRSICEVYKR